ncbi:hypothetical protein MTO96_006871 [Rhipicephalus appendiculatus]
MPPETLTNLTLNIPVYRKGVKDSSMDGQKQLELPDHESKAVQPPAMQTIQCAAAQAVASHRWSDSAVQAYGEIQTWPCKSVETDACQPRWAVYHPGRPCPFHPVLWGTVVGCMASPAASRRPGRRRLYCRGQGRPSPQHPA